MSKHCPTCNGTGKVKARTMSIEYACGTCYGQGVLNDVSETMSAFYGRMTWAQQRELIRDALRWRALLDKTERLRILGSANIDGRDPTNWAHFGLEAWSRYPADAQLLTASNCAARDALIAYADGVRKIT